MNPILMLVWAIGNLIIFSSILYLKSTISGASFDTFLIGLFLIGWVFGQLQLVKETKEKKK